jgi:hypothetical protein
MLGMLRYELSFQQVEEGRSFAVGIFDLKAEEAGQVQDKEEGEVGQDAAFGCVQMEEGVFDKIEQLGVGLGLLDAFLQQLHHKERDGVLYHVEKQVLVEDSPFEFPNTLQILQLVVIDHEIEDGRGLEEIGLTGSFAGARPDPADQIGLDTEQFRIDSDDKARFAVFHPPEDDSFGLM